MAVTYKNLVQLRKMCADESLKRAELTALLEHCLLDGRGSFESVSIRGRDHIFRVKFDDGRVITALGRGININGVFIEFGEYEKELSMQSFTKTEIDWMAKELMNAAGHYMAVSTHSETGKTESELAKLKAEQLFDIGIKLENVSKNQEKRIAVKY